MALLALGDYAAARDIHARLVEVLERVYGVENPQTLNSKMNLAMVLNVLGDCATARDTLVLVTETLERTLGPEDYQTLESKLNLAIVLDNFGDHSTAKDILLEVLEIARRNNGPDIELRPDFVMLVGDNQLLARTASALGLVFGKLGDFDQSIFFLKISVDASQNERARIDTLDKDIRRGFLSTVECRYHRLYDALMKAKRTEEALSVLDLLKGDEMRGLAHRLSTRAGTDIQPSKDDLFSGTPDEWAYRVYSGSSDTDAAIGAELAALIAKRGKKGLTEAEDKRVEELTPRVDAATKAFLALCRSLPELIENGDGVLAAERTRKLRSRQQTLENLGGGSVLVHAVSTDDTLYLVLVTPHAIVTRTSKVGRRELAGLVSEFRSQLQDTSIDPRPAAKRLYDLVFRPIDMEIESAGAKMLMLSLDGNLRYLPFAALWDGEHYLAEKYPTALFTESTVDKLRNFPPDGAVFARALGVTASWPDFPALPSVAGEIASIVGGLEKKEQTQQRASSRVSVCSMEHSQEQPCRQAFPPDRPWCI
jgi:tetratricopeptide (TPR) repeat protein